MSEDKIEENSSEQDRLFDEGADPRMVIIPGDLSGLLPPPRKPPTLAQVAWSLVWSMLIFFAVVALSAAIITWLWNSNLTGVEGLPSIDLRTAASVVIFIKLAAFLWKGHR